MIIERSSEGSIRFVQNHSTLLIVSDDEAKQLIETLQKVLAGENRARIILLTD